jgi:hypothetical protein
VAAIPSLSSVLGFDSSRKMVAKNELDSRARTISRTSCKVRPTTVIVTVISPSSSAGEMDVIRTEGGVISSSSLKRPVQEKLLRRKRVVRNRVCTLPSSVRFRAREPWAWDIRVLASESSWRSSLTRISSDSCSRRR